MIDNLPPYINLLFGAVVLITIIWFAVAARSRAFVIIIICWTILQTVLGLKGIYQDTTAMPPKVMLLGVLPALVGIVITFLTQKGKIFMDNTNLKTLTYFHSIRIPVEIVLLLLYLNRLVPVNI